MSSQNNIPPLYSVRKRSGIISYRDVRKEHIVVIQNEFRRVLEEHFRNHTLVNAYYAPQTSSSLFGVQCEFGNKIHGGIKDLTQRSSAVKNRFQLLIGGNCYEPVFDDKFTATNWEPITSLENHQNDAPVSHSSIKSLVLNYLESSDKDSLLAFHSAVQKREPLVGRCHTPSAEKPCIFTYKDCWEKKELSQRQLSDVVERNSSRGNAYKTDNAHMLADNNNRFRQKALIQLFRPIDQDEVGHYILNIPVDEELGVKIPSSLEGGLKPSSSNIRIVTANIAPQGTVVDLHIDHGQNGLSTTEHDCVKLWFLCPPTTSNLDNFYKISGEERKFVRLQHVLRDGVCAITTQGETLYIPSGWLHATLTVKGGILLGVNWTWASDVSTIIDILVQEYRTNPEEASFNPLINSCELAIISKTVKEFLTDLCPQLGKVRSIFKENKNKPKKCMELIEKCFREASLAPV
ncbi:hypothetical protein D6C99_06528 [Aureobasidium pullulans]|nr:hypothetical protein D6C99_06528 [Aureobasidium pullulans]